jgi:hypothetical protein
MMNSEGCERKPSWFNLIYCTGICLEGLRKNKIIGQNSQCLAGDLNPGIREYEPLHHNVR